MCTQHHTPPLLFTIARGVFLRHHKVGAEEYACYQHSYEADRLG